jgi:hypothetical protein
MRMKTRSNSPARPSGRRRLVVAFVLGLCLVVASLALSHRLFSHNAKKPAAVTPEFGGSPQPQTQLNLAKEYVYAGGRLIATEEAPGAACAPAISPTGVNVGQPGGSGVIIVSAAAGCSWTVTSSATWITITSGTVGTGNGSVSYSVTLNPTSSGRTGTITIAQQTFAVTQAGCTFGISPAGQNFAASGGAGSVAVSTAAGCAWTAVSETGWITITSDANGVGTGTVNYSVTGNGGGQRAGSITVAGQAFNITQNGVPGCNYSIFPAAQNFSASAGGGTFSVTTTAGCAWTATTSASWITITAASGSGTGTVSFSVGANTGPVRNGTINLQGQIFTVSQASGCSFSINPISRNFGASGGAGSVLVSASNAACSWTATSNAAWLTITSGASGAGNGTVNYAVSSNPGATGRSATLTIAGINFAVTQDPASSCVFSMTPVSQNFAVGGGSGSVGVTTQSGCGWAATSNSAWITITPGSSGSGSGTVNYSVSANAGPQRSGSITIDSLSLSVTQDGVAAGCTVSLLAGSGAAGYGESVAGNSKWNAPSAGVVAKHPGTGFFALFVADTNNHRVRLVYLEGPNAGTSALIAGNGIAGYSEGSGNPANAMYRFPRGIAAITDVNGAATALLIADTDNHVIRKLTWSLSTGAWTQSLFSGKGGSSGLVNGSSATSRYNAPQGIVSAANGTIYVADTGNNVVRKLTPAGDSSTLSANWSGVNGPVGVAVSATNNNLVQVSFMLSHNLWQVDASSGIATLIAGGTAGFLDGTGSGARFNSPRHITWVSGDQLLVADNNNHAIRKVAIGSGAVTTYAGTGMPGYLEGACLSARFQSPYSMGVRGPEVYVLDKDNHRIRRIQ